MKVLWGHVCQPLPDGTVLLSDEKLIALFQSLETLPPECSDLCKDLCTSSHMMAEETSYGTRHPLEAIDSCSQMPMRS